ncbi:MAG: PRC and DUF2382 domain-containing protein [Actinomycetota bacterium]|nr:PRC and DUF2382 domain-containing protein [Actinomycetota bacterium]
MTNAQELQGWIGRTLIDSDGGKIGRIEDIYMDEDTGQPEWLAVSTGWFGNNISFVPLAGAAAKGDDLCSRWTKEQVKDAPHAEPDGQLTQEEEARLYRHYGLDSEARSDSGPPTGGTAPKTQASGTDDAMTRSEEELRVGKTTQETGRVRLRKWVETEQVSTSVPVTREEVRVEREPITSDNLDKAMSGPEISEAEHEVTLHEEQVVANTEVVPKERVRLEKDVVTDEEPVSAELRKERIDIEGDAPKKR